jgi:hypothetical protein
MPPYLPKVTLNIQNPTTEQWVPVEMDFDTGSSATNLPVSYAPKLGIDLKREEMARPVETVGGEIGGYVVNMQMAIGEYQFNGPIIFRESSVPPLMGIDPVFYYFSVYIDNSSHEIKFIPLQPSKIAVGLQKILFIKTLGSKFGRSLA